MSEESPSGMGGHTLDGRSLVSCEVQHAGDTWRSILVTAENTKYVYPISQLPHDFRKHAIPIRLKRKNR